MIIENEIFKPHWPEGLEVGKYIYQIGEGTKIGLLIKSENTIGIRADSWVRKNENPRTHQALIWLAEAIRLDNEQE